MLLVLRKPAIVGSAGAIATMAVTNTISQNCPANCKGVSIPYPFGIGDGCYYDKSFELFCGDTLEVHIDTQNEIFGVNSISLSSSQAQLNIWISFRCYDSSGNPVYVNDSTFFPIYDLGEAFRLSNIKNKFTATGCNNIAIMYKGEQLKQMGGCFSTCSSLADVRNQSCTGQGCCQIANFEDDIQVFSFGFGNFGNYSNVYNISPCSSTFIVDQDWFDFSSTDLNAPVHKYKSMPLVVDWAIRLGNETCQEAKANSSSYACRSYHSECLDSTNGPGYICNCYRGFEGNPYLPNGCQDIDECTLLDVYPCNGTCINTLGSYDCPCFRGYHGDGKQGTCIADPRDQNKTLKILLGTSLSIFFSVVIIIWIYLGFQKRKLIKIKQQFFEQNGGFLLQEHIKSRKGAAFKIFTKEELEKATNKFNESKILGRGGFGTVYKGTLNDNRVVAIKISKLIDEGQKKEFAKEMAILSQLNHKNIVKILGCCLEVEVPMLVYEFVPNGTLYQYIHHSNYHTLVSLDTRLRIAEESADALAYLHSYASPAIVHSDIKPSNILLDETYSAKVSDFGASKLAPSDENQMATLVQGTCGYLDPEYLQTWNLTTKSDVYSFGVVLLEILTGKKAIYFEGPKEEMSLTVLFKTSMQENRLGDILGNQTLSEEDMELVEELAILILQCLNFTGKERPTMKEVAADLKRLSKYKQHPWKEQGKSEELRSLLQVETHDHATDGFNIANNASSLYGAGPSTIELSEDIWSKGSSNSLL